MSDKLNELKAEAKDLGINFSANIGEVTLQEKIDAYYKSQETSEKEVIAAVQASEATEDVKKDKKPAVSDKKSINERAKESYEKAKKTVVVTIIDNDKRVNNQTTTCTANWSNQFHDLGTKVFPLNMPIEVPQGFINVLKEVMIPMHTKDPKTGLSRTTMRPRYTISKD